MGRPSTDVHADPLPTRALRTLGEVLSLCGGISAPTAIQALVTRCGASVDPEEMTLRSLESQLKPGAAFVTGELVLRDLQFSLCTVATWMSYGFRVHGVTRDLPTRGMHHKGSSLELNLRGSAELIGSRLLRDLTLHSPSYWTDRAGHTPTAGLRTSDPD